MPPRSPTGPSSNAAFERRDDKGRRISATAQQLNQHLPSSSAFAPHTAVSMGDVERAVSGGSGSSSGGALAQQQQQQQDEREALLDRKGSKGALRSTVQQGQVVRGGGLGP